MTCPPLIVDPGTCRCGRPLDIEFAHELDGRGDMLCPACCPECEPERKNMTPEELSALPEGAIVLVEGDPLVKEGGRFRYLTPGGSRLSAADLEDYATHVLLHPAPEPDHSMCAIEPRPEHYRSTIAVDISEPQSHGRRWVYPAGHNNAVAMFDEEIIAAGGSIPDPEPTVVERAAKVLADKFGGPVGAWISDAQKFADAGLLREDAS